MFGMSLFYKKKFQRVIVMQLEKKMKNASLRHRKKARQRYKADITMNNHKDEEEEAAAAAEIFVVVRTDLECHTPELSMCCYTQTYDVAATACEEYSKAWISINSEKSEVGDLFDEALRASEECIPLPTAPGYYLRYDDEESYSCSMRVLCYHKKASSSGDPLDQKDLPPRLVCTFGVHRCNMWIDDYVSKVTPAVLALNASDSVVDSWLDCKERLASAKETSSSSSSSSSLLGVDELAIDLQRKARNEGPHGPGGIYKKTNRMK